MKKEFVSYEQAVALKELKELGSKTDYTFGRFYTKPRSKMFGVDEKGRHYPIKNTPKKLYTLGEHFVLNDINVIPAPLRQQVFRWLSLQLNDKDIMIPVDYEAQDKLIDVLIDKLKTKHLLL